MYAIYLGSLRLPTNPTEFDVETSRGVKEYDILVQGTIGKPQARALNKYKWSGDLPGSDGSDCVAWQEPKVFIDFILSHMKEKEPLLLVVSNGTNYGLSQKVLITSFTYKEVLAGTYEYDIVCTEFVDFAVTMVSVPNVLRPKPTEIITKVEVAPKASTYNAVRTVKVNTDVSEEEIEMLGFKKKDESYVSTFISDPVGTTAEKILVTKKAATRKSSLTVREQTYEDRIALSRSEQLKKNKQTLDDLYSKGRGVGGWF